MKKWQSILAGIGITTAAGFIKGYIPDPTLQLAAAAGLAGLAAAVNNATSNSNPNGTPAAEPYTPPTKKAKKTKKAAA